MSGRLDAQVGRNSCPKEREQKKIKIPFLSISSNDPSIRKTLLHLCIGLYSSWAAVLKGFFFSSSVPILFLMLYEFHEFFCLPIRSPKLGAANGGPLGQPSLNVFIYTEIGERWKTKRENGKQEQENRKSKGQKSIEAFQAQQKARYIYYYRKQRRSFLGGYSAWNYLMGANPLNLGSTYHMVRPLLVRSSTFS